MTVADARRTLATPKFGDERHIAAVRLLERLEYAKSLSRIILPDIHCASCDGYGSAYCDHCGRDHNCPCCDGEGGRSVAESSLTLDDLNRIVEQLETERRHAA